MRFFSVHSVQRNSSVNIDFHENKRKNASVSNRLSKCVTKSSADILDTSTPEKAAAKPEVGGFVLFRLVFFLARRFRLLLACGVKVTAFLFEAYANELWCSKADGCARDRAQATDLELSACVSSTTLFPSPTTFSRCCLTSCHHSSSI